MVYLRTLAPGLTWANGGEDGGDLIAAAATGGIPHPTGYPLYLLTARLFQLLPLGPLAYRTNLMSAVFTAAAGVLIYAIVVRHLSGARPVERLLAGLAAGFCFGLSPLAWSQAVITEVYALQAFLVALLLYLYTSPAAGKTQAGGRGLALGLALGNHITTLLLAPLLLLAGATQSANPGERQTARRGWLHGYRVGLPALGIQFLGLLLGLSLYLVLPLRAGAHPPVSWGNPVSGRGFLWLVSGRLYQDYYLQLEPSNVLEQARGWAQFGVAQLGLFGLLLGLLGLVVFGRVSRLFVLTGGAALLSLAFSHVYRPPFAQVYLLPLLISFSIWLGIGLGGLAGLVSVRSRALAAGVSLLVLGMILLRSTAHSRQVDASQDARAEDFARQVLAAAPQGAMLFAEGDGAIFALWYYHFALHERPDLVVLARDLVPFDWYQEGLRHTYPSLVMPGPIVYPETLMRANPDHPACSVRYVDRAEMECTTLQ